jgi:hypothetical protein
MSAPSVSTVAGSCPMAARQQVQPNPTRGVVSGKLAPNQKCGAKKRRGNDEKENPTIEIVQGRPLLQRVKGKGAVRQEP